MNECYPSTIREEELKNRVAALRSAHRALAAAIEPKVYEYGFLMR